MSKREKEIKRVSKKEKHIKRLSERERDKGSKIRTKWPKEGKKDGKKRYKCIRWPRSYRKYILQITQPFQSRYAKLQYRFAVTTGSPSINSKDVKKIYIKKIIFKVYDIYNIGKILIWWYNGDFNAWETDSFPSF